MDYSLHRLIVEVKVSDGYVRPQRVSRDGKKMVLFRREAPPFGQVLDRLVEAVVPNFHPETFSAERQAQNLETQPDTQDWFFRNQIF